MSEEIQRNVSSVVTKIFETMFFIFVEHQEEPGNSVSPERAGREFDGQGGESPIEGRIFTEIEFRGKKSGRMNLLLPRPLAQKMAVNFMGLGETEISESEALDVAKELTNMISGNLFSLLEGKGDYQVTVPTARMIRDGEMEKIFDPSGLTMDFLADGQRFSLHLSFKCQEDF